MSKTLHLRSLLVVGASAAALTAMSSPAYAQGSNVIEELVVTAQRREESLQDVPVAVSAFSEDSLRVQRIDGGQNLLQAIPNVNFSRSNFGGYNLSIRGIGTKVVGSGEAGVSFHQNNTPQSANHLADAEFYDVERVEVLRGPQGTLYGRNATGGVVNVITVKPIVGDEGMSGWLSGEYGNYKTTRVKGAINIPLNDMMALRWAASYVKRDGYGDNTFTGNDIDDRDLTSSRLQFRIKPNDVLDVNVLWEHFNEKDSRSRIGKQLCIADPGPATIGGVATGANRNYFSQGCLPGSRYQNSAFGAVNSVATLGGLLAQLGGLSNGDLNAGKTQDHNLLNIESVTDPIYQAQQDFFQIDAQINISDTLTLASLTGLNYNEGYSYQDYNRIVGTGVFTPVGAMALVAPGGFVTDPQVGRGNKLRSFDLGRTDSKEFSQELRLFSNSDGPWNFSVGGLYTKGQGVTDYYVFSNSLTAFAQLNDLGGIPNVFPFYVDPNFPPSDNEGRNYYDSRGNGTTTSKAVFGEVYWDVADTLKLTAGLRYTDDHKVLKSTPITLLAGPTRIAPPPGSGVIPNPNFQGGRGAAPPVLVDYQNAATTGRLNLQWTPELSFTEASTFYATYARGYKAGGFNTPCDVQTPGCSATTSSFTPENLDAFEIGTKNSLLGGSLILNATAFYYNYKGYQISKIVNKSSQNENVDAKIKGVEIESIWEPIRNLRFNLQYGWLDTEIQNGASIDTMNRTQGNPNLVVVKATDGSNCVATTAGVATLLTIAPSAVLGICSGLPPAVAGLTGIYNYPAGVQTAPAFVNNAPAVNTVANIGQGIPVQLTGKELPNSPKWTFGFGAQYKWELSDSMTLTARADYYRQDDSYARIFNTTTDALEGYQNVNATITLTAADSGLDIQIYGKNLTDEQPITDLYLTDDSSGLFTNTFSLEPRQYGVTVTKKF
ncbi:MAG: TonB-dependent receptor [Phenylobacterium sp.]|uniref:TonB-dependent receptor n=1 Tax=Phenylobacterium sp. TaxID=1871053 RepID=UPI003BB5FC76